MLYRLPIELWTLIIRRAIAQPFDRDRFNPPLHDFERISGFAGSSTTFRDIVQVLKDEMLIVDFSDIEQISPILARRAKYLEITNSCLGNEVLDRITGFSQLTSFSVVLLEGPVEFLLSLQSLTMSQTLQSIDIRSQLPTIFNPGDYSKHLLRSSTLSFPKLERLRLSDCDPFSPCEDIIQEQTMVRNDITQDQLYRCSHTMRRDVAAFFSGCRNLQLLSIHIFLDKEDDILRIRGVHYSSLEHLVPSEGYEQYLFKCPLCLESYDYAFVVRSENIAARIFAEKLPNLSEIRWLNLWVWDNFEEGRQRRIRITRQGNTTKLTRDDGREESPIVL